jgi:hypothetical protein
MPEVRTLFAIACLSILASPSRAQDANPPKPAKAALGEQVADYQFPALVGGDGRSKLSDFFGQPVLVEVWDKTWAECIDEGLPHAIQRARTWKPKGMVVILIERRHLKREEIETFLWRQWPGFDVMACVDTPNPVPDSKDVPYAALIGCDGTLVWHGKPTSGERAIADKMNTELQKMQKGFGDSDEQRRLRAAIYGRGAFADGKKVVDACADEARKAELKKELEAALARRVAVAKSVLADDRWLEARDLALALQKGTAGVAEWQAEIAGLVAPFQTPEGKKELQLDDKLQKLFDQARQNKVQGSLTKAMEAIVKPFPGTRMAGRVDRIVKILRASS